MKKTTYIATALLGLCMIPGLAQATTGDSVVGQTWYKANDYLTRTISSSDILKWTVRTVFDRWVELKGTTTFLGDTTFHDGVVVDNGTRAKNLTITGDSNLGNTSLDSTIVAGKIARPGGPIWIYDDLRVEGELELKTASIGSSEITDGTVSAADLADAYQPQYAKTLIVSPVGTAIQNGQLLEGTIEGISDASASNRYLVKVEPGIYETQTNTIDFPQYVDMQGSGENVTIIQVTTTSGAAVKTLNAADDMVLSDFTVRTNCVTICTGLEVATNEDILVHDVTFDMGGTNSLTGVNSFSNDSVWKDISITMTDASSGNRGLILNLGDQTVRRAYIIASNGDYNYGILSSGPQVIEDSQVFASNSTYAAAIRDTAGDLTLRNVYAEGTGATYSYGVWFLNAAYTSDQIDRSVLIGDTYSVKNDDTGTIDIGVTKLDGAIDNTGGGTYTCVDSYDGSYAAVNASCL